MKAPQFLGSAMQLMLNEPGQFNGALHVAPAEKGKPLRVIVEAELDAPFVEALVDLIEAEQARAPESGTKQSLLAFARDLRKAAIVQRGGGLT